MVVTHNIGLWLSSESNGSWKRSCPVVSATSRHGRYLIHLFQGHLMIAHANFVIKKVAYVASWIVFFARFHNSSTFLMVANHVSKITFPLFSRNRHDLIRGGPLRYSQSFIGSLIRETTINGRCWSTVVSWTTALQSMGTSYGHIINLCFTGPTIKMRKMRQLFNKPRIDKYKIISAPKPTIRPPPS